MATPGELIEIVAAALKLPAAVVTAHYRALREADLVTKGGRGRSAPSSTSLDAARLLISLLAAEGPGQVPMAVAAIGQLYSMSESKYLPGPDNPLMSASELVSVHERVTLETAIAALLVKIGPAISAHKSGGHWRSESPPTLSIFVWPRQLAARISIERTAVMFGSDPAMIEEVIILLDRDGRLPRADNTYIPSEAIRPNVGLEVERRVRDRAILQIADALYPPHSSVMVDAGAVG